MWAIYTAIIVLLCFNFWVMYTLMEHGKQFYDVDQRFKQINIKRMERDSELHQMILKLQREEPKPLTVKIQGPLVLKTKAIKSVPKKKTPLFDKASHGRAPNMGVWDERI